MQPWRYVLLFYIFKQIRLTWARNVIAWFFLFIWTFTIQSSIFRGRVGACAIALPCSSATRYRTVTPLSPIWPVSIYCEQGQEQYLCKILGGQAKSIMVFSEVGPLCYLHDPWFCIKHERSLVWARLIDWRPIRGVVVIRPNLIGHNLAGPYSWTKAIVCFHVTSRRPGWCTQLILWELSSIIMQTLSFVSVEKQGYWSREWKHSIWERSTLMGYGLLTLFISC